MMNTTITQAIHIMSTQFSGNEAIDEYVCKRCIDAVSKGSVDTLCDKITLITLVGNCEEVIYTMGPEKVETRLKEIGLYQLVTVAVSCTPSKFYEKLGILLLSSFGCAEVENEIRKRAIEAVNKGCMEPLMKEINIEWRDGEYFLNGEDVIAKLKEKGIWQLVADEISKQKRK